MTSWTPDARPTINLPIRIRWLFLAVAIMAQDSWKRKTLLIWNISNEFQSQCLRLTIEITENTKAHKIQIFFFPIISDIQALAGVTRRFPNITRDPTKLVSNSVKGEPVGDLSLCRVSIAKVGQVKHNPVSKVPRDTANSKFLLTISSMYMYVRTGSRIIIL